jgi:hypothetical protein
MWEKFVAFLRSLFDTQETSEPKLDEVDFSTLQWFGYPDHGKATLVPGLRLANLKVNASGLSFKFVEGGCELLGAPNASNASFAQACVGYKVGAEWRVSKFDWISSSRNTRDFKNIRDGYNGFSPTEFFNATEYCFVICGVKQDKDIPTNKRSNVIYFKQGG